MVFIILHSLEICTGCFSCTFWLFGLKTVFKNLGFLQPCEKIVLRFLHCLATDEKPPNCRYMPNTNAARAVVERGSIFVGNIFDGMWITQVFCICNLSLRHSSPYKLPENSANLLDWSAHIAYPPVVALLSTWTKRISHCTVRVSWIYLPIIISPPLWRHVARTSTWQCDLVQCSDGLPSCLIYHLPCFTGPINTQSYV